MAAPGNSSLPGSLRSTSSMEAAPPEQLLLRVVSELSSLIGRSASALHHPGGYAELFQAVVSWAAPGAEPANQQTVPSRACAAANAFLSFMEVVRTVSRDKHMSTNASTAGAGPVPREHRVNQALNNNDQLSTGEESISKSPVDISSEVNNEPALSTPFSPSGAEPVDPQRILCCVSAPLLLFCGAHVEERPWTDSRSRRLAARLLQTLLQAGGCDSVADLLKGPNSPEPEFVIFREALGLLGPLLRKDTWESHPEAKMVFSWLLCEVPRPWLTDFLSRVMPPSLLFSDDFKPENKVLGVRCLHHIIKNTPAADLRQYNRAMVVYHALRNHLYTTEAEVIEVVLPCLMDLFPVLHKPPPPVGSFQKDGQNPADQVMQLVLTHMEMEHKIALRRLYARNLPALQERLGVRIVRHMKRLLSVIVGYLEICDGPEETARLCILETLKGTIKYAWPRLRVPSRISLLVKALLKLIYDVSAEPDHNSQPVRDALLQSATECLILLDDCSKGQVKAALEGIPTVCTNPDMVKCINRVLEDAHQ